LKEIESNNYDVNRQRVIDIYGGCANCETTKHLTTHHIIPRSEGGDNHKSNLICLCRECHDIVENKISNNKPRVLKVIFSRRHKHKKGE